MVSIARFFPRHLRSIVVICLLLLLSVLLLRRHTEPNTRWETSILDEVANETMRQVSLPEGEKKLQSIVSRKRNETKVKALCRSLPGYFGKTPGFQLNSSIVDGVATMLFFIGYARSGHSLIGSLLDAHPNIVIANEYNVLERWLNFSSKNDNKQYLFQELYFNSYKEANKGDRSFEDCSYKTKYNYAVPHQWQGKFNQSIKIIGDKKGGKTSLLLQRSPIYLSVLKEIRRVVDVPIKFIHVVRNPFDNVATLLLRVLLPDDYNRQLLYQNPLNISKWRQTNRAAYFIDIAWKNNKIIKYLGKDVITIKSEDVINNPRKELAKICSYLNVTCSEDFLRDCSSIVYRKPSKSRNTIIWDNDAKEIIKQGIKHIEFFRGYTFKE